LSLTSVVGREAELDGLRTFLSPVLGGDRLSFAGLGDLLGSILDDVAPHIPTPQKAALDVALLRAPAEEAPPDPRSIATATLSAVRWLAVRAPLVIAIDDRQWLDQATGDVVEFVRRRLVAEPVGFLETTRLEPERRSGAGGPSGEGITTLELGPLSPGALHELVRERFGRAFPRPTLMRIHKTSGGNPFYALEIARLLFERGTGSSPAGPSPYRRALWGSSGSGSPPSLPRCGGSWKPRPSCPNRRWISWGPRRAHPGGPPSASARRHGQV